MAETLQNVWNPCRKEELVRCYAGYLYSEERSANTIEKYSRDLQAFFTWLGDRSLTREAVLQWKESLRNTYAATSINSMLAAVNLFLRWLGYEEYRVRPLRIQKDLFARQEQELHYEEYVRLVQVAKRQKNQRLALVLQTICATGIRVSELAQITVEALCTGRAVVHCKGKQRIIFLPRELCQQLKHYSKQHHIKNGPVFRTRTGQALHRTCIWRWMKALCAAAGVMEEKVFPHNLRHLFARTYYRQEKDIVRLADLLGHSSINTTRIYTMESGAEQVRQLNQMHLVLSRL